MLGPIKIYRGDQFVRTLVFTDENDAPIDLTGYTIKFTVRKTSTLKSLTSVSTDTEENGAVIIFSSDTHLDAVGGITTITISGEETNIAVGEYSYDIFITDGVDLFLTLGVDKFVVDPDVTRDNNA